MKIYILTTLFFTITTNFVNAQWKSYGPSGGTVLTNIQVGTDLYIGTATGIYKSSDGGQKWSLHSAVVPDMTVLRLHFDGSVMYASLVTSWTAKLPLAGLYVSLDTGKTWTHKTAVIGANYFSRIVESNGKIFLLKESSSNKLYSSSDQGKTWKESSVPFFMTNLWAADNTLFAIHSSSSPNLFRSTDEGATWVPSDTGMIKSFTMNIQSAGSAIYAFNNALVYTSTNKGSSWKVMTPNPTKNPKNNFPFVPQTVVFNGQRFFGSNGGNTYVSIGSIAPGDTAWSFVTNNLPDGYTLAMFCYNAKVFCCKDEDLYATVDEGTNWSISNSGMTAVAINSVSAWGDKVLCGGNNLYISNNSGLSWEQGKATASANDINGFYKFKDTFFVSTNGAGIFESTDGKNWSSQSLGSQYFFRFTDDGKNVYVGSDNSVFKTTNNGATWTNWSTGLPSNSVVIDLKVLGNDIYACVGSGISGSPGVYKSPLSSPAWTLVNSGLGPYTPISIENIGNTLYVGLSGGGVFKSTDYAMSWTPDSIGIGKLDVHDLAVSGNELIAGTDKGVWILNYGENKWKNISYNLPSGKIKSVSLNSELIFAATEGHSVWQISTTGLGKPAQNFTDPELLLIPNPAHDIVEIHFNVKHNFESVKMYDLSGRLLPLEFTPGNPWTLNVRNLVNGVYFVQMDTGEKITTRKLHVQH